MKKNEKKETNREWSLEELENEYWKNLEYYPTKLVERCFKFRKIPLKDLTIEEIRTLIGQQIGLDFLLPIAYEHLEKNILSEGDFYEGDLLESVLRTNKDYWLSHLEHYQALKLIINNNIYHITDKKLINSIDQFFNIIPR